MRNIHRTTNAPSRNTRVLRRGSSLLEAAVSTLLVGVLLTASMRTVGSSLLAQNRVAELAVAQFLANGLVAEIVAQKYLEPGAKSSIKQRESGESGSSRAQYDDVDDYNGWTDSPPQNKAGVVLSTYQGWQRRVSVEWVDPSDIQQVSSTETSAKRIIVTVSRNGTNLVSSIAVRTNVD